MGLQGSVLTEAGGHLSGQHRPVHLTDLYLCSRAVRFRIVLAPGLQTPAQQLDSQRVQPYPLRAGGDASGLFAAAFHDETADPSSRWIVFKLPRDVSHSKIVHYIKEGISERGVSVYIDIDPLAMM